MHSIWNSVKTCCACFICQVLQGTSKVLSCVRFCLLGGSRVDFVVQKRSKFQTPAMKILLAFSLLLAQPVNCHETQRQAVQSGGFDDHHRSLLLVESTGCDDRNWQCYGWAQLGHCATNAGYMNSNCRKSCNRCGSGGGGRPTCRGLNQPCWVNAQCCSARCHPNTYHCRPVGR